MKLEMHVHTKYSNDSLMCFLPLYLKCRVHKIDCIAITEHNSIDGAVQFKEFCEKRGNKLQVIVGEEISTSAGEIIGLYLKENIESGLSAEETIRIIKSQGGVVYIPHPFDVKRSETVFSESAIAKNQIMIDCIEIHNGRNFSSTYDFEQKKIADKYKITPVVGSDAHTWIEVGRNYLDVEYIPLNSNEFMKLILCAKFTTKSCLRIAHVITKMVKIIKLLGRGKFNELHRLVTNRFKRC